MAINRPQQEASAYTKFRLLMWKNFLQQWRNKKLTSIEILLPVFIMTMVVMLRWLIKPIEVDNILRYPPIPSNSLNYSTSVLLEMNITELSIAYSPYSPELDDIVKSAVSNLVSDNVPIITEIIKDKLPNIQNEELNQLIENFIKIDAYNNSRELQEIYRNGEDVIRKVIAAVEFDDRLFGATELPINISYALRFPERPRLNSFLSVGGDSWRTDDVFPSIDISGPRFPESAEGGYDPGYVKEMFIALQNAMSIELISRVTGEDLRNFTIDLQRYPHPPYVNDMASSLFELVMPLLLIVSYSYTGINFVRAITTEKELELKETMKIMGLPTWLHWTAWFFKQLVVLLIPSSLIVIILKVNWFTTDNGVPYAVITNTPWTVLLFLLVLYAMCIIFFCFMLSGFFSKATTAVMFAEAIWILSGLPAVLLTLLVSNISPVAQGFTCLLVNCAAVYGLQIILARESAGGLQWDDFFESSLTGSSDFYFGYVVIMFVVNSVLYMSIALYFEQVLPGPFGTAKPWYFLFTADFWLPSEVKTNVSEVEVTSNGYDYDVLKDEEPTGHEVGVKISNLTKIFGPNVAVDNLSLNIYDDQITVLLGHNGAGKSTTISMLTGNLKSTHGTVTIAGYDISRQQALARSHIGLCPQHDVLFKELTVKEHLIFYAKLKGFKGEPLRCDIETLIEKLELHNKRNCKVMGLSGGQKRRLCVGIALCGAARVILLDEPTSGMDPSARRSLWELLQQEKIGRSVILTTHFMDEADFLADRVAIMAHGRLQCVGTPNFLKRHHGMGYTFVVVKDEGFDYEKCVNVINRYIPNTSVKEDRGSEINFHLNNEDSAVFETMLDEFEKNINEIKFRNYGLIATTLEDVFMKVGADLSSVEPDSVNGTAINSSTENSTEQLRSETKYNRSRTRKFFAHVFAVWMKLILVFKQSWGEMLLQLLLPAALVNVNLAILGVSDPGVISDVIQSRNLTLTEGFLSTETFVNYVGTSESELGAQAYTAYQNLIQNSGVPNMNLTVINSQTLDDYYLDRANETQSAMDSLRQSVLIGATFDDTSATAWFSNFGYHDVAVSLNAVHAALLRAKNAFAQLRVYNFPLESSYTQENRQQLQSPLQIFVGIAITIISSVFVKFYIKERTSGAKLLQKAAGLQPIVMWGSAFIFDWLWFLICCLSIIISCFAFRVDGFSTASELGRLFLCIVVYGAATLPMIYLFSLMLKNPALGYVFVFFTNLVFGVIGTQVVEILRAFANEAAHIVDLILQFFPMYALSSSFSSLTRGEDNQFDWISSSTLRYLLAMLITGAILWTLLMIVEYRLLHSIIRCKKKPQSVDPSTIEMDVADEEFHVSRIDKESLEQHGLVSKGLSKYYGKHLAVNQIGFSVNEAECFGLLGVNGAGKTTTFKMLMGDESMSSGEAYVSGYSVQTKLNEVYKNIGYCPQETALFPELTGRQTLRLFAWLRGVPKSEREKLAHALGIDNHLDKRIDQCSGGTKRKVNTAVALLGHSRLVFVDEPTTGVDPAAKRQIWRALRNVQTSGRGVLLTSHSMEECEALCSRLTIMVNGRFQCLGTPQHLKNKYSEGYTLTIKLKQEGDSSAMESATEAVKQYVQTNFEDSKIMEEYQGILTFYLKDNGTPWSKMFGVMERAKRDLSVEYYNISQTTLEQIFLQFTKYQKDEKVGKKSKKLN